MIVKPSRRSTNVTLDTRLVADAKEFGINVSRACEIGLAGELKKEREARWRTENAEAIRAHNDWVEKHGIPLAKYRMF